MAGTRAVRPAPTAAGRRVVAVLLRLTAAGLTAAMAAIHLHLWAGGFQDLAVIGVLFLLNAVGGTVLALALLAAPARLLPAVAGVGALFTAGTLGALLISLSTGLFGFHETVRGELVPATLVIESAGTLLLAALALAPLLARRRAGP
ncbi:hypothetical protein [Streptomyces sp. NPDC089919]|uniref:hypothetical protein n=1 Tax=Streptomyces sp. NPDC089919 TaxID=3155188 RepID=UPI0034154E04